MLIAKHKERTTIPKTAIWSIYTDVSSWAEWDKDLDFVKLDGHAFVDGATGILKPKTGPSVKFTLSGVLENRSFTCTSFMPLTKMVFSHRFEDNIDGTTDMISRIDMYGTLSLFFSIVVGRKIKAGLPTAMQNLLELSKASII